MIEAIKEQIHSPFISLRQLFKKNRISIRYFGVDRHQCFQVKIKETEHGFEPSEWDVLQRFYTSRKNGVGRYESWSKYEVVDIRKDYNSALEHARKVVAEKYKLCGGRVIEDSPVSFFLWHMLLFAFAISIGVIATFFVNMIWAIMAGDFFLFPLELYKFVFILGATMFSGVYDIAPPR